VVFDVAGQAPVVRPVEGRDAALKFVLSRLRSIFARRCEARHSEAARSAKSKVRLKDMTRECFEQVTAARTASATGSKREKLCNTSSLPSLGARSPEIFSWHHCSRTMIRSRRSGASRRRLEWWRD